MKIEKFNEFIENLKLERETWQLFSDIESIVTNDNIGYYPNWQHLRFLISDNEIYVCHGTSIPYGARLAGTFSISSDNLSLQFLPGKIIAASPYYNDFPLPKMGDIIRSTMGTNKVLSENLIINTLYSSNCYYIKLMNPLRFNENAHLSFYVPSEFDKMTCVHGTESEGIYMKFIANEGKNSKIGVYQEIIKVKNIKEINLKVNSKLKTYKIV